MPGRLVAEQQLGPLRERARDRDALRLAAGELAPAGGRPSRRARRARAALGADRGARPAQVRGEGDVLERGEVRQQVRALEDVGDARARAPRRARPRRATRAARPATRRVRRSARRDRRARAAASSCRSRSGRAARGARRARSRSRRRSSARDRGVAVGRRRPTTPAADASRAPTARHATRPSRISTTRSAASATRGECVTTTTVLPNSSRSRRSAASTSSLVARVELRGRLVGEHERRLARRGGGDRDALLLAARERAGALAAAVAASPNASSAARPRRGRRRRPREPQRRRATFSRAVSVGQRLPLWKTIATSLRAVRGELALVEPCERAAEDAHLAGRRLVEPGGEVERRALARARRPEDARRARRGSTRRSRPRSATVSAGPERKILKTSWNSSAPNAISLADARARGRGSSPPPEALDHQPVGVDVVDALPACRDRRRRACRRAQR